MNVVIMAYHYPPDPAVGSLRPAKVARALRDAGHRVTVVASLFGDAGPDTGSEPGITVLRVRPQRSLRDWWAARKHRPDSGSAPKVSKAAAEQRYVKPRATPLWKRAIFSLLWLPDDRQGFIAPAVRAALPLVRHPDSVLYTTAPPFSTQLAGWWLRKRARTRWVAEFRDPWTDNPWKPDHVRTRVTDAMERAMERRVLGAADLVVAVSEGIERGFRARMGSDSRRLMLVRNGIDTLATGDPESPPEMPFRILHIGSFYHGRDPRPFFRALAAVATRRALSPADVTVDLVGNCRWFQGESMEQEVTSLRLGNLVHFHDWVPHARAQEMVHSAGALLLLAQNQPDQVPNKLYEYLGARRAILAYVDDDGESASMLRQVGGHYLVTGDDPRESEAALETLIRTAGRATLPNEDLLRAWTTQSQMQRLIERIEEI